MNLDRTRIVVRGYWCRLSVLVLLAVPVAARAECGSPGRVGHAAAFHPPSQRLVVFGGETGNALSNALWAWNGSAWECMRSDGPSPRSDAALAWDERRQVLVLYGNRVGRTVLQDTWELGASGWTNRSLTSPTTDPHPVMGYDHANGAVLMFAGLGDDSQERITLRWNGAEWSKIADEPRSEFPNAFLPGNSSSPAWLVTARRTESGYEPRLYNWANERWAIVPTDGDSPRFSPQVPTSRTGTGAILYAGFERDGRVTTWTLQNNTWTKHEGVSPSRRRGSTMTYDPVRGVVVMHGGDDGSRVLDETWEWKDKEWRRIR